MHSHDSTNSSPIARSPRLMLGLLLAATALAACGSDEDADQAATDSAQLEQAVPTSSTGPVATQPATTPAPASPATTDTPSTTSPTSPPTTPASTAAPRPNLPAEPRVLYEWYPAGEDTKTIIVSDETLATPSVRIVPEGDGAAVHSSWSTDGSQFTWEVLRGNDTSSVWTADADGSNATERVTCLADPCVEMSYPAFSPDDSKLLVTQFDLAPDGNWGVSHLVVVDLATREQTVIASTADGTTSFYSATWSPDASKVAVALETYTDETQNSRSGAEIVVYDTDPATDDDPVTVTPPDLFAGYPRWHPTDDRILFASWDLDAYQGTEPSQLYTVASDGSQLQQITHVDYAATQRRPGEATWTPNGNRIIAGIGVVINGGVGDVKIAYIDPTSGEITETEASGAMPALQPT
ncbi:MAG: TolB family protein [Acidimicrobiia bacterium]